jgi:hypothetical protein
MIRAVTIPAFLAGLLFAGVAGADSHDRSNAPVDIAQLPVPAQAQAIENEYAKQSHGRRIADGHLNFYLDQIAQSHWSFGKIHDDIARSLGNAGGWRPPSGWKPSEVICTSSNSQYRECRAPFDGPARLSQQMSDASCVENSSWGSRPGMLWVDAGCRGRFVEDHPSWPDWGHRHGRRIICESQDGKYQQCNDDFQGPAQLSKQVSRSECTEGRSWGQGQGMVWVSRGCRAWFEDGNPGSAAAGDSRPASNYHITCASTDGKFRSCPWKDSHGVPKLIEQLSNARCEEGRTWGYRNGSVWVDSGCRGRFGPQ